MGRFDPKSLKRIVIKVGSSSIAHPLPDGFVRLGFLGKLATTIARLQQDGVGVAVVSSGAIALGARRLFHGNRPDPEQVQDKQACASVGQMELMTLYEKLFSSLKMQIGQVLLTREDLEDSRRTLNARKTLLRLLDLKIVPIINENDSVSVEEIRFGDNDRLSALVADLIDADLLILLTDVPGLYDADPQKNPDAKVVPIIDGSPNECLKFVGDGMSAVGSGGMRSKLAAATICRDKGIHCVIAESHGSALDAVLRGECVGTYAKPRRTRTRRRSTMARSAAERQGDRP